MTKQDTMFSSCNLFTDKLYVDAFASYAVKQQGIDEYRLYQGIVDVALRLQVSLDALSYQDFLQAAVFDELLLHFMVSQGQVYYDMLIAKINHQIIENLQAGQALLQGKKILHTAPHHDDIVLGYHTYLIRQRPTNEYNVLYMTSGSRGVADEYIQRMVDEIMLHDVEFFEQVLQHFYHNTIELFAQAYHQDDAAAMHRARHLIFCNIIVEIFEAVHVQDLIMQVLLLQKYVLDDERTDVSPTFMSRYNELKGRLRQSESDSKWMIMQGHTNNVRHMHAQCYDDPSDVCFARDVDSTLAYLEQIQPDIITVAFDPAGVGPASHFMTLQVITQALQQYCKQHPDRQEPEIMGYRNIWSNFSMMQADLMVPVSENDLQQMESIFTHCFASQQESLCAAPWHDGPFSHGTRQIQEHQAQDLAVLLHPETQAAMLADTAGVILLKIVTVDDVMKFVD